MIDLETIAMQRAEQQMRSFRFSEGTAQPGGMPMTDKTCAWSGCGRKLGKTNRSGYCARCSTRHWREIKRRRA